MDRQKILMIFGVALVGAGLLTWLLYRATSGPKQEKLVDIMAAGRDMPAGTRLSKAGLRSVKVAEKDVPRGAMTDERVLFDRVLLFPVTTNEAITASKLASLMGADGVSALIEPGKRAVSVQVNDSTSAAGLITPRAHVDVLFTRPGAMHEAVTTTVLQDITVLSIGRVTEVVPATAGGQQTAATASSTQNRAVTLLVSPEQAEKLELAKNQGKISLSLRNPLDKSVGDEMAPTTAVNLYDPTALRKFPNRNANAGGGALPRGNNIWAQLTGQQPAEKPKKDEAPKEPPKPRFVVDVYRGDKHVQEIFQ